MGYKAEKTGLLEMDLALGYLIVRPFGLYLSRLSFDRVFDRVARALTKRVVGL